MRFSRSSLPLLLWAGFASACPPESNSHHGKTNAEDGSVPDDVTSDASTPSHPDSSVHHHDAGAVGSTTQAICTPGKLDVLFMIDDSGSMKEEQGKLAAQLPNMIRALTSGDLDGDGKQDIAPAEDLHLGLVSSDMGADGVPGVPTCGTNVAFGDDGLLISSSRATEGDCSGYKLSGSHYLGYTTKEGPKPDELAANFACLAKLGTSGCGFEQQLEATYKALAPHTVKFGGNTTGHGDKANAGFLREDAALATILISDEDDCSITDEGVDLFLPSSTAPSILVPDGSGNRLGLNLRCAYKADDETLVHPVSRYIDGLKALKPGRPDRVIFSAIIGMPVEDEGKSAAEILTDARMRFTLNPLSNNGQPSLENDATTPNPACVATDPTTNATITSATPGTRMVKTAEGFGDNGLVHSICADDFAPAIDDIVKRAMQQMGSCD